jgi:hypothetical protein
MTAEGSRAQRWRNTCGAKQAFFRENPFFLRKLCSEKKTKQIHRGTNSLARIGAVVARKKVIDESVFRSAGWSEH